jgi:TonB family protein
MGLPLDYTWLVRFKLLADYADITFVDIYTEAPMKTRGKVIALVALALVSAIAQDAPKKITKAEALSAVASKVQPAYPAMARQLKIQGVVELDAIVAEDGSVAKVEIVSGNPVLTAPAAEAVKHWKFKPFTEDGKPIRVMAPIALDFKI